LPDLPEDSRPSGPEDKPLRAHFRAPGEVAPRRELSSDEQFTRIYQELKARAQSLLNEERPGHTLQATALVNEAYLKLSQQNRSIIQNQSHALALAAIAMRRILVDHARGKQREKRGGKGQPVQQENELMLTLADDGPAASPVELLSLERALEILEQQHPRLAKIVELRFYGGLTNEQTANVLGVSIGTIESDWRQARSLLADLLK